MAAPTTTSALAPEAEQLAPLNEPSMEDILASIRRIIAEDQSHGLSRGGLTGLTRRNQLAEPPLATVAEVSVSEIGDTMAPASEPVEAVPVEEPELHEVSQADMLRGSYETESVHAETLAADRIEAVPSDAPEPHEPVGDAHDLAEVLRSPPETDDDLAVTFHEIEAEPLVSPSAGASITSSFQALAESVVLQDPGLVERIMRETMRPLLKDWLDDHLPSIVERLVRVEIERVARGGRGRD